MITVPELAADALSNFLGASIQRRYGSSPGRLLEVVPPIARIAIECIANSDALYHNVEHTMLVTLAGHDILRGRALHTNLPAEDYGHLIIACLLHDIGYVRGVLKGDNDDGFVIDADGKKVTLPRGASDAALFRTTSTDQSSTSWSGLRRCPRSMKAGLYGPSNSPGFPTATRRIQAKKTKKARSCGRRT